MLIKQYITERTTELQNLMEDQTINTPHWYALMAGQYELLRMAVSLTPELIEQYENMTEYTGYLNAKEIVDTMITA